MSSTRTINVVLTGYCTPQRMAANGALRPKWALGKPDIPAAALEPALHARLAGSSWISVQDLQNPLPDPSAPTPIEHFIGGGAASPTLGSRGASTILPT
jgi:hypothetical protein